MLFPNVYLSNYKITKDKNFIVYDQKLHSKYKEQEYKRILQNITPYIKVIVLIGAGNGEILLFLLNSLVNLQKILIIEPISNFIEYQKTQIKINFDKIQYIYDTSQLFSILQKYEPKEYFFLIYPVYKRLFPELVDSISLMLNSSIDKRTILKFTYLWQRNYFKNLFYKRTLSFIVHWDFKKKKILFCGGGPTLLKDLKQYKNLNEFFIISSDTAVIPLLENHILIDWVISIDPNIGTMYHFYKYKEKLQSIPLITWLGGRQELSKIFSNVFFFITNYPLDQILHKHYPEIWSLSTNTRDVKGYLLSIADLTNSEIFMAGCGVIPSLSIYYYKGTGYDYYGKIKQTRKFSLEHYHYQLYTYQKYKLSQDSIVQKLQNQNMNDTTKIKMIDTEEIITIFLKEQHFLKQQYKEFKLFYDFI